MRYKAIALTICQPTKVSKRPFRINDASKMQDTSEISVIITANQKPIPAGRPSIRWPSVKSVEMPAMKDKDIVKIAVEMENQVCCSCMHCLH